jgi:outer membrane lipoprotein SlyB
LAKRSYVGGNETRIRGFSSVIGRPPDRDWAPSKGQLKMQARPGKTIGEILPVNVAVANGTNEPYRIQTDQIFAISLQGRKVMPVPIGEAIKEVVHSNALRAEVTGAAKSALVGGIAGAAAGAPAGAVVGTIVASPAQGVASGLKGWVSARDDAESQMRSLSLQTQDVNPNRSSDGYVFFPNEPNSFQDTYGSGHFGKT